MSAISQTAHQPSLLQAGTADTTQGGALCPSTHSPTDARQDRSAARMRVFVADDEPVMANTLTIILNRFGYEARAVYSGEAAVNEGSSFEPDVLICDVKMAGMTGVQAAMLILASRPNCHILLFSGQAGTSDLLAEARAQGHRFEILAKPVHPDILLRALRNGVGRPESQPSLTTSPHPMPGKQPTLARR